MSTSSALQHKVTRIAAWLLLLGMMGWWAGDGLLGPARHVGYAICHQIRARSYLFGDLVLPLCARCTGQYLGLWIPFVVAWGRGRLYGTSLPRRRVILLLALFLLLWAFDGLNSYATLLLGEPWLYPPQNRLRLVTGLLQGIAIGYLYIPFFNRVFWAKARAPEKAADMRELFMALILAALLALAVESRYLPFFYPLAILSTASAFLFLSSLGVLLLVVAFGAESQARAPRELLTYLLPAMTLAATFLAGLGWLRSTIESHGIMPPLA
ncbi:MAG: DUF2085 domain-containing protein [Caldilineae bacterium]|nr:MAG: DUF2085 domain-containing protein [Caldilineae bacterium]